MRKLFLMASLLVAPLVSAQELHTFSNGEVADAENINENFFELEDRIKSLTSDEIRSELFPASGWHYLVVDCTTSAGALADAWVTAKRYERVHLRVSGSCDIADQILRLTGQKMYLDGGTDDEKYGEPCKSRATVRYVGDSTYGLDFLISNSSFYLNCISFDSSYDIELRAYRNSLVSTRKGVEGADFDIDLSQNSTFYSSQETPRISMLVAEGNSVAEFAYTSVVIEGGLLDSGSKLICKGCIDPNFGYMTFALSAGALIEYTRGVASFDTIFSPLNSYIYFGGDCDSIEIQSLDLGVDARINTPFAIDGPCSFPN